MSPDVVSHGWWLASRSAGIVAMLAVTASVVLGLLMANRLVPARRVRGLHEQTALVGLVAIGVHALTLLGDPWLHPGPAGIAVPFSMAYRPLWTGLGIVAGWLAAALGLSFYARRRIGPARWRKLHRLTAVVYVMALVHALGAGTDAATAWLRGGLLASAIPVVALLGLRLAGPPRRRATT